MRGGLSRWATGAAGAIVLALGCGDGDVTIGGTVTVDGVPLDAGFIAFASPDGASRPVTVVVSDGRYRARTRPGRKIVQISALRVVDRRRISTEPDAPLTDVTEERIPERYNARSTLSWDVPPGGGTRDFAVETDIAPP